jgi:hypothetical protein
MDEKDFLIVTGVNHQQTGFAVYCNFAVYNFNEKVGMVAVSDDSFAGSAAPFGAYGPPNDSNDYFYAVKIAYDCAGTPLAEVDGQMLKCVTIPRKGEQPYPNATPGQTVIWLIERAYMHPTSLVGPADTQMLDPSYVLFKHESSRAGGWGYKPLVWLGLFRFDWLQLSYALVVKSTYGSYVVVGVVGFVVLELLLRVCRCCCCHTGGVRHLKDE